MNVFVIVTCVPGEPEPCWPSVYSTRRKAEKAFKAIMREEWESTKPENESTCKPLKFPRSSTEAHARLVTWNGPGWGQWGIFEVEMDYVSVRSRHGWILCWNDRD